MLGKSITAGWGSSVIGDVRIADGVTIGAGCVVVCDVMQEGVSVAGLSLIHI